MYVNNLQNVEWELGRTGDVLAQALTLNANVSTSRPLFENMEQVDTIAVFLDTNMLTLTAFLAILSA